MLRFRVGTDAYNGDFGWKIDDIAINGIANTPFYGQIADMGICADSYGDGAANGIDCAPDDPGVFAIPLEVTGLLLSRAEAGCGAILSWDIGSGGTDVHEAGVVVLAGTDVPNSGTAHGVSMHRELELLVRAGLTPVEALAAGVGGPLELENNCAPRRQSFSSTTSSK